MRPDCRALEGNELPWEGAPVPACCIVYVSDQAYLFPTFVSAMQARQHASADKADVMICHFGLDAGAERDFAGPCRREGIGLMAVDPGLVEGASPMMARLFLNRFMPPQYAQYLYIDGDTHITGPLDPLLDAEVPAGRFLAANDPMAFMLADKGAQSRDLARHMALIGLTPEQAGFYFNTGVLRINRSGWDETGLQAWDVAHKGSRTFRFPDQDPLNIVAVDSHMPMSLAWNFPIFMLNARVEADIKPCIYHFMSSPKPWQGVFQPWGPRACAPYADALRRYPSLSPYNSALPLRRRVRYHLQQGLKKASETVTWGHSERRRRILHYEKQAARRPHG